MGCCLKVAIVAACQIQPDGLLQVKLYLEILHSQKVATLCSGHGANDASALSVLNSLKKLCNMPDLLYSGQDGGQSAYLHTAGVPVLCCFRIVSCWPLGILGNCRCAHRLWPAFI